MKLFLDENLSPAQAMKLREEGFDAVSLYEVGLGGSPDEEVRKFAIKSARVLATATPTNRFLMLKLCASENESEY